MNFIRDAIGGRVDEFCHRQFVRYGKGEFERLLFGLRVYTNNFNVKASFDFGNELFHLISENIKEDAHIKGKVIVGRDFKSELNDIGLEPADYSRRGKLYTAEFDCTANPHQLKQIFEQFKYNFILLSVSSKEFSFHTKPGIPKLGGKVKDNFCSASLPLSLLGEFAFDFPSPQFKQAKIMHKLVIDEVVIPKEYEGNAEQERLNAKRKGKLIRIMNIDGREFKKEYDICV